MKPPERFVQALESVKAARLPGDVMLQEIPAPSRAAPFAMALEAEVAGDADGDGGDAASATFVLLHRPGGHIVWRGDLRLVTVAKASVEPEFGPDPFIGQVAWSYLAEALEDVDTVGRPAGTVTRTVSEPFGDMKAQPDQVGLEVRASWTPATCEIGRHLEAYLDFLCHLGGVEPLPKGVVSLAARMNRRHAAN